MQFLSSCIYCAHGSFPLGRAGTIATPSTSEPCLSRPAESKPTEHASSRPSKRARLEAYAHSESVTALLADIGAGRTSIRNALSHARASRADGSTNEALNALSSIAPTQDSHQERDLHRWVHGLYGLTVQPEFIWLDVESSVDGDFIPMSVAVLPPTTMFRALFQAGTQQFCASLLGTFDADALVQFWGVPMQHNEWAREHPAILSALHDDVLHKLIPFVWHVDGCEMHRNQDCIERKMIMKF